MERHTLNRRKSSNIRKKCVHSESAKRNSNILSPMNFNSETLSKSSPIKPNKVEKPKTRKKKIRRTQDFNQLSSSVTSQDSDLSVKSETKKTRKPKRLYALPKIDNLIEDPCGDKENELSDTSPNVNVLQKANSVKKESFRKQKMLINFNDDIKDAITLKYKNVAKKVKKRNGKNKSDSSIKHSKEYQCAASEMSDANGDSEVEIKFKNKMGKKGSSNTMETDEHYVKRIRKMLLNDCEKLNEESPDNGYLLNLQTSHKEHPKNISIKKRSVNNMIQQADISKHRRSKSLGCENGNVVVSAVKSPMFDEVNEQVKYVGSRLNTKDTKTKSNIQKSKNRMSHSSESSLQVKKESKQNVFDNSLEFVFEINENGFPKCSENVGNMSSSDDAEVSDDVFQPDQILPVNELNLNNRRKKQDRKSVRFASLTSKENVNSRNTFDIHECTNSINLFNMTGEQSFPSISRVDNDFQINNPQLLSIQVDANSNVNSIEGPLSDKSSQYKSFLDKSVSENNKVHQNFKVRQSKGLSPTKMKNNSIMVESLSPIYGKYPVKLKNSFQESPNGTESFVGKSISNSTMISSEIEPKVTSSVNLDANIKTNGTSFSKNSTEIAKSNKSIVDLTTPNLQKLRKDSDVILIKSSSERRMKPCSLKKLRRKSTFSKDDIIKDEQKSVRIKNTTLNNINPILKDNLGKNNMDIQKSTQLESSINAQSSFKLTTPVIKKLCHNSDMLAKVSGNKTPRKLHRQYALSKTDHSGINKKLNSTFDGQAKKSNSINLIKNDKSYLTPVPPKLSRTATFTIDVEDNVAEKNIPLDMKCNASGVNDSLNNKLIDTSKVTKRRQWDKSKLSMSFLGNSLDIGNVAAPWKEDTLEKLQSSESPQLCELEISTKTYKKDATSPLSTSTPLPGRKSNLLKKASLKEKHVTINESKNLDKTSSNLVVKPTRTKMPNFALIHQRQYDKLESLKEMSERKAQRAKLLLSGRKPNNTTGLNTSSKSKKLLHFSPTKSKHIPLNSSTKFNENRKKEMQNTSNISITKIKNITPSKSNAKVVNIPKESILTPIEKKKELLKQKSRIPTKLPKVIAEKEGFTRYGFKVRSKEMSNTTREEQLKAVASKTKITKNTVQERRNIIQGVRSNRRFELLMSLRNK